MPPTTIPPAAGRTGARGAATALALLLLLVAVLAGSLSQTAHGTASLRGGAASIALTVAVTLVGLFVVVFGVLVFYGLATSPRGSSEREGIARRPFWRGIAVALVLPVIAVIILLLHRNRVGRPASRITTSPSTATPSGPHHSSVHFVPAASLSKVAIVVLLGLVIALGTWLAARRHGKDWNLGDILRSRGATAPTGSTAVLAESIGEVRVPDPEEEVDPRRAVVAAYVAMTSAAATAGAARRHDETASEFLERLLSALGASHAAARRLTYLFETARYSTQPFEETLRSDAIAALRQVQAELTAQDPTAAAVTGAGPSRVGVT
ncbi:MAG: DUF4129 domain-containing protein [Acidimicrobiales bacterium]|jgi:hypothetical protein